MCIQLYVVLTDNVSNLLEYLPSRLPIRCLTMVPRFDTLRKSELQSTKPLFEINSTGNSQMYFFIRLDLKRPFLGQFFKTFPLFSHGLKIPPHF